MTFRHAVALVSIVVGVHGSASAKEHAMSTSQSITHLSSVMTHATELTVYHVDSYLATRTPIAPEKLETYPDVEVHVVHDRATIEKAYAEFEASRPTSPAEPREYRWKLSFADASKHRIAEIYVAAFAQNGAIDAEPIAFGNDSLVKWLRATFAPHEEHEK